MHMQMHNKLETSGRRRSAHRQIYVWPTHMRRYLRSYQLSACLTALGYTDEEELEELAKKQQSFEKQKHAFGKKSEWKLKLLVEASHKEQEEKKQQAGKKKKKALEDEIKRQEEEEAREDEEL
eukprot:gnl/TRDRNA2_/TRDRNA2_85615_c0_seq1.p1 gnl/TRDRNA2_/TRDRNA2_85615_c0~~gnl/TRDRNA2_/TRDRNA2_85615_c0_seq1.p1  ORF type:complete len:123 (+),score=43.38 gnl/TRDRNA2_/TRDRNA2_85615_c0_seq1:74-442(+)